MPCETQNACDAYTARPDSLEKRVHQLLRSLNQKQRLSLQRHGFVDWKNKTLRRRPGSK